MAKHDMTCEERQVAERAQRTLAEAQLRYGVRLPAKRWNTYAPWLT
ncbi:hypothetical protein ACFSVJ_28915 [Prauserella oleivorans]